MDLYVYYRVPLANTALLQQRVLDMQRALRGDSNMAAALKRRPETKDGCQTWMEVYLQAPEDFPALLTGAAQRAGLMALIDGERHVEIFVDVDACA